MTAAPTLLTGRLRLRAHELRDFEPVLAMSFDPAVHRFIGGAPADRTQVWEKFLRGPGFWPLLGFGLWVVEERATGAFVGQIGFGRFERAIDPPLPDWPEGAWVLASEHHGKGFAGEALTAALAWADDALRSPLCCIIAPENSGSLALAHRHGFRDVRRAVYHGEDTTVLERPAPPAASA